MAVLAVILVDLLLRVTLGLGNPVLYQYSPRAGYVLAPSQSTFRFLAWNNINRWGMRCPDFTLHRPKGTFRAMFIGDSVTYGTTFVGQSKIFTSRIGRLLPGIMHKPVQVLNASCGAWAIGNEVGYLESRGTFNSNIVVFVINTGDLNQPFNRAQLIPDSPYPDHPPFCALSELWFRYLWPRIKGASPFRDAGSFVPTTPVPAPHVDALLSKAKEICEAAGARLAIVYHPFRGRSWSQSPYPADLLRLKHWCRHDNVPLLDLTTAYAHYPTSQVYYSGVHLKPFGNRLAANAIAGDWWKLSGIARSESAGPPALR
jgi:hypothetical protein